MKIFSIHSPLVVIFCCRLVSSVNVSCKQELVTADLSLVIGSHPGLWLADIMTAWHAHKTGIIIITVERHAAGSAAVAQFYVAPDICRLQGTAGDSQGTSNLFWQQTRHQIDLSLKREAVWHSHNFTICHCDWWESIISLTIFVRTVMSAIKIILWFSDLNYYLVSWYGPLIYFN